MARHFVLSFILLHLTGCGTNQSPTSGSSIAAGHWGLRKLAGEVVRPAKVEIATIRFRTDGGIDGTAICNSVFTGLTWTNDSGSQSGAVSASFGRQPIIKTVVGCGSKAELKIADHFWDKMDGSSRWSRQGNILLVVFQGGESAEMSPVSTPASQRRPTCAESNDNNLDC